MGGAVAAAQTGGDHALDAGHGGVCVLREERAVRCGDGFVVRIALRRQREGEKERKKVSKRWVGGAEGARSASLRGRAECGYQGSKGSTVGSRAPLTQSAKLVVVVDNCIAAVRVSEEEEGAGLGRGVGVGYKYCMKIGEACGSVASSIGGVPFLWDVSSGIYDTPADAVFDCGKSNNEQAPSHVAENETFKTAL